MNMIDALNWRYATKIFDPVKKIPADLWEKLESALILSPSSYGLQPYKFFVIENPDLRKKLREVSWKQSQVTDASHYVVFAHRTEMTEADITRFIARTAQVRGVPVESLETYKKMMVGDLVHGPRKAVAATWASRQVYIALGQLMTAAAALGVDTCPMEGLSPADYDKLLGLEGTGYATVCACALGYRSTSDKYATAPKVRYEKKDLIVTK